MKKIYEVSSWSNAENPQRPDAVSRFHKKADALREAKTIAARYGLVEVSAIEVNPDDENDLWGELGLVKSWKNGKVFVK